LTPLGTKTPLPHYPIDQDETGKGPNPKILRQEVKPCASPGAGFLLFGSAILKRVGSERTEAHKLSLFDMTHLILKAIDLGASTVFMALCTASAFCALGE
jgi:hypothetical protein